MKGQLFRNMVVLALMGAGVVVVGGAARVVFDGTRAPHAAAAASEESAASPQRTTVPRARPPSPSAEPEPAYRSERGTAEQAREARQARQRRMASRFDQLIEKEPPDLAWKTELEAKAEHAKTLPVLRGADLAAVKCGATVCRATFSFADREAQRRIEPILTAVGPLGGGDAYLHTENDTDQPLTTVYFSRSGNPLPFDEAMRPEDSGGT